MPSRLWYAMNKSSFIKSLTVFVVGLLVSVVAFNLIIPKSDTLLKKKDFLTKTSMPFHYVALGDSLTQGVGDTTDQGGFVPILSQNLTSTYHYNVSSDNFGISGNTSQQILKRLQTQKKLQKGLQTADMMTLTVGGNDVMAVIRQKLTNLKVSSFVKPQKAYQQKLRQIITLARKKNAHLPIYVLGIYNPFYLNFPEMTQMQDVIDNWNEGTKAVTKEYSNVYFVPINNLLYKGVNGKEGITQTDGTKTEVLNDALFEGDHFHPNNIGYQIMSDAVMEKIRETKKEWK